MCDAMYCAMRIQFAVKVQYTGIGPRLFAIVLFGFPEIFSQINCIFSIPFTKTSLPQLKLASLWRGCVRKKVKK
jgi:hypothetical protein